MVVALAELSSVGEVDLLGSLVLGFRAGLVSLITRGSNDGGMVRGIVPVGFGCGFTGAGVAGVVEGLFVEVFVVD